MLEDLYLMASPSINAPEPLGMTSSPHDDYDHV